MSRFFAQGVALLVLVTLIANSNGQWYDCGTTLSQRLVRFNTFTAYPSPAIPGQQVHLRATYQAYAQLDDTATVELNVLYGGQEQVLAVTGIPLCNLTSSVSCPVVATPNYTQAISFDWLVPSIADGTYLVNFKIRTSPTARAFGCIAFNASISNPSATQNGVFVSSYQAQLEGDAQFTTSPFLSRDVGTSIQVGPFGPLGSGVSWGTFDYVSGTGDVVHPSFDPTNYIWGMSGTLVNKSTDLVQSSHVYQGQFWIGYSGPYGNYNTRDNMLTNGTFVLTHSQLSVSNYTYSGVFVFLPSGGAFPTGWFNPINLARLGPSTLNTNQYGHLIASASAGTCLASPTLASCTGTNNQVTQAPSRDDDPHHLKIILPVVLGVFFVLVVLAIIFGFLYRRKQRKVSEDRVYNPRPAEYGSALVVDDIMQKSRNHTGAELPILDPSSRQAFPPVYLEEYPAPVLTKPRTVRRTPQEPRRDDRRHRASTRQDRRPAPRRPVYSDTDSEPQLRGRRSRSPSRGRDTSRSRSISRSRSMSRSRSRSMSPSDRRSRSRSRSISRSMSRSRSPASGSSMSRSSFSEGPRR